MNSVPAGLSCASSKPNCAGPCPGYGSRAHCPPLIVLAFRAVTHAETSKNRVQ
ncbi:hypothetical protein ACPOL_3277 [Acidisarcina polymorpha]|uniref:Uncharacterized protein n=1 Tax=Acidisarcina polymorpha TaxID=2211140 RepID=A0A2Z5G0P4_9BACT|nr:hypothetical protein [Acidisarcina polymorpha]AXC12570.1 hypothetical protein ACPOL_3277 [Acidisarcina polymorpha]